MGLPAMEQRENEVKRVRRRRTTCILSGLQNVLLLFTLRFCFANLLDVVPICCYTGPLAVLRTF